MAAALGLSPYMTTEDLVTRKKKATKLRAAACTFGRVMEDVAKQVIKDVYGYEIEELGAIPSTRYPLCYSPDGLVVCEDRLKLVEIKCPFRRSKLSEIPKYYLPQIQTGMNILPCEEALFYQFRFRCCKHTELGASTKYNRWLHSESYKRCPVSTPTHWGWIHFEDECDMIDLGALQPHEEENLCSVEGLDACMHRGKPERWPDTGYVLPWKLFDHTCARVPRDAHFLEEHSAEIWDAYKRLCED